MKISMQFQYLPDEDSRPNDESNNNEPIEVEDGQFLPIPAVGDTVFYESYEYDYDSDGKPNLNSGRTITVARKVRTRHFDFKDDLVQVNLVVVDVPEGEMGKRLKE